jgi:cyclic beta-1,2-glucan synthetase
MEAGTLIGYFSERNEARRALRELPRRGFRRAALVHETADGDVHTRDPFLWRRALGATLTAVLFGGLAGVASLVLHWQARVLSGSLSSLVSIFAGGFIGTLFGTVWIRRSKYGVERKLLEDHARWLVPEETVLILQAPIETLQFAVAVLRESRDIPPALFVLHPPRESHWRCAKRWSSAPSGADPGACPAPSHGPRSRPKAAA